MNEIGRQLTTFHSQFNNNEQKNISDLTFNKYSLWGSNQFKGNASKVLSATGMALK